MIATSIAALLLGQTQVPQESAPSLASASPNPAGETARPARARTAADPASLAEMQAFGRCAARRAPAKAAALLQMDYTTPQYQQALRKLALSNASCSPGKQGRFAGVLFAGAVAEELLSHAGNLPEALAYDPAKTAVKTLGETDRTANCVARTASREVAALFATPVASEAERAAIRTLTPVVETCMAKGQTARFNYPGLRAILATASYRIVEAGRTSAAAG
ncbi:MULTISPECIES: hypothetical protein [Sphingomonas]|uniref:hypothetical protein n=1 Tax=Sphingomonas TaxID=13687 RepID=UPI000F7DE8F7|nr:hypothetical protein [Sphingomonas sp. ABOLF]RSV14264.1 hypothetical protein CA235_12520 [Sphingomonas sp. ABOLF]GLK21030.1 hypothetical protein GCM10017606_18560 [Microbacterium terregens]